MEGYLIGVLVWLVGIPPAYWVTKRGAMRLMEKTRSDELTAHDPAWRRVTFCLAGQLTLDRITKWQAAEIGIATVFCDHMESVFDENGRPAMKFRVVVEDSKSAPDAVIRAKECLVAEFPDFAGAEFVDIDKQWGGITVEVVDPE